MAGTRTLSIYPSQPGLGVILGARVLAEFGDDPHRFADAKARKNYAGTSPITRASGTKKVVLARYARNRASPTPLQQWAFCSLQRITRRPRLLRQLRARKHRPPSRPAPARATASSASCTAASRPAPPTTKPPPGPHLHRRRLTSKNLGCLPR